MPQQDAAVHRTLLEFARYVIAKIPRLDSQKHPLLFSEFLKHCSKPVNYKNNLIRSTRFNVRTSKSKHPFKTFIKYESYPVEFDPSMPYGLATKNPRAIQCPSDTLKAILLPIVHQIDECLFSCKWFVKKVPVLERPAYILEQLKPGPVAAGDYTSFEAHHNGLFLDIIEEFVRHVTYNYGNNNEIARYILSIVRGQNACVNKTFSATFQEGLCSGLPWTSTFNSVLNVTTSSGCTLLRPWKTTAEMCQEFESFGIVIEGDDSLFNADPRDEQIINLNFERAGAKAKLEFHSSPRTASFCGIIVDHAMRLATNPIKIVCNFFVLPVQYSHAREGKQLGLLKAKAYSYAVQYYSCPIVAHLCYNFCKRYKHIRADFVLEREKYNHDPTILSTDPSFIRNPPVISDELRQLVEEKYHLTVEYQIEFERLLGLYGQGQNPDFPSHAVWEPCLAWSHRFTGHTPESPVPYHDEDNFVRRDAPLATPFHRLPWLEELDEAGYTKCYVFNPNLRPSDRTDYPLRDPPVFNAMDFPPDIVA